MRRGSKPGTLRRKSALAAIALLAVAAVALGRLHPFGDPRQARVSAQQRDLADLLRNAGIPSQATAVLVAKCADCHSNATRWPLYSRVAPASWLVEHDVVKGRKRMNLSTWDKLTPDTRQALESKIAHETKMGDMPPLQYRAIHWGARLSREDLQALSILSRQGGAAETGSLGAGDAERGEAIFERRCTSCHALDANHEGPHLRGVYGRKAGSVADFRYSTALKGSNFTWNDTLINQWLTDPDAMLPGNIMDFRVVKASERADLVAFLKQLK